MTTKQQTAQRFEVSPYCDAYGFYSLVAIYDETERTYSQATLYASRNFGELAAMAQAMRAAKMIVPTNRPVVIL